MNERSNNQVNLYNFPRTLFLFLFLLEIVPKRRKHFFLSRFSYTIQYVLLCKYIYIFGNNLGSFFRLALSLQNGWLQFIFFFFIFFSCKCFHFIPANDFVLNLADTLIYPNCIWFFDWTKSMCVWNEMNARTKRLISDQCNRTICKWESNGTKNVRTEGNLAKIASSQNRQFK